MKAIGTKVYYTGDMANHDGNFEVVAYRGQTYDLKEIGGDRVMNGVYFIADEYKGNCAERFVTQESRQKYRDAAINELRLAAERRAYLAKQAA